jgi:hypothetical protein
MSQIEVELTRDAASDEAGRARKAEAVRRSGFGALQSSNGSRAQTASAALDPLPTFASARRNTSTDVPNELSGHRAQ